MKKKNVIEIGNKEIREGMLVAGETILDDSIKGPIPIESLKVLMTGDSNDKFRVLSKKINSQNVKVILKHRETSERVKIVVPIEFLELHKIPYKNPVIPTNLQIKGVLEGVVRAWECIVIIKELSKDFDLVILLDKESQKQIACKVPIEEIINTKQYIEKSQNYSQLKNYNLERISLWRENEWQKEIMTKVNLLKLTHSTIQRRV